MVYCEPVDMYLGKPIKHGKYVLSQEDVFELLDFVAERTRCSIFIHRYHKLYQNSTKKLEFLVYVESLERGEEYEVDNDDVGKRMTNDPIFRYIASNHSNVICTKLNNYNIEAETLTHAALSVIDKMVEYKPEAFDLVNFHKEVKQ